MRPTDLDSTRATAGSPSPDAAASEPAHADLSGRTLGDYRVERLLGRGGMGEVYLARQLSLDRPVAFKVLRPDALANQVSVSRFEAEAGAAARINHPNIVHIYQHGKIDGLRFIAMEYVPGTTLREFVKRKGPPDLPAALQIMKQAAQAIGAAGEVGLVHRDIKPDNLLLTRKGQIKVADFGLCRFQGAEALNLTQKGVTLGTPMYMSPEQVQGHEVDHRSDLYSLGVTSYFLLTGRPPFEAETAVALAMKHVRDKPPNLAERRPDLPPALVALIHKLLAKNPALRYASAAEVLKDLATIRAAVLGTTTTQTVAVAAEPTALDLGAMPGTADADPSARPPKFRLRPASPLGLTALVVLGLALGATLGWRSRARDLLGDGAPEPSGPPALWLAPAWKDVPRARTAEAQYRQAQLKARAPDLAAAWLAVPGHFPTERRWTFPAYVQLARQLYRAGDVPRLRALAVALNQSDNPRDQELARVAHAASAALIDDEELLGEFSLVNPSAMDPAVVELALEIVSRRRIEQSEAPSARRLQKLRNELLLTLQVDLAEFPGLARPR